MCAQELRVGTHVGERCCKDTSKEGERMRQQPNFNRRLCWRCCEALQVGETRVDGCEGGLKSEGVCGKGGEAGRGSSRLTRHYNPFHRPHLHFKNSAKSGSAPNNTVQQYGTMRYKNITPSCTVKKYICAAVHYHYKSTIKVVQNLRSGGIQPC